MNAGAKARSRRRSAAAISLGDPRPRPFAVSGRCSRRRANSAAARSRRDRSRRAAAESRQSAETGLLRLHPAHRQIVIVADALAFSGRPIRGRALVEFWRLAQLLFGDVELVGVEPRVVGEPIPGQRIEIRADAEETAETHDGISNLARPLIDHHPHDLANGLAVRAADLGTLDLVAGNQAVALMGGRSGSGGAVHQCLPGFAWLARCENVPPESGVPASPVRLSLAAAQTPGSPPV